MATFIKLSLRRMIIMPIVTGGLYFWWWFRFTRDGLFKVGNYKIGNYKIGLINILSACYIYLAMSTRFLIQGRALDPHFIFIIGFVEISLLSAYFFAWVRYVQEYMRVVKKSADRDMFFYYLGVGLLPSIIGGSLFLLWILRVFPNCNYELLLILPADLIVPFLLVTMPFKAGFFEWFLLAWVCVLVYLLNLARMLIFQKGFNEYQE